MIRITLLLTLIACQHSKPAVVAPKPPARNLACQHAQTIAPSVCLVEVKGGVEVKDGKTTVKPDVALVDFGKAVAYCWSGEGIAAACGLLADFNPPKQEQPKPEAKAEPAPPPPASAPTTPPAPTKAPKK